MFLSNRPTLLVITCIFALFLPSCGSGPANESNSLAKLGADKKEFPFSTTEPEVFQGNFFVSSGDNEKRWFVARKGDSWRLDIFDGGERSLTQLKTDKAYLIDHIRRTYCEPPRPSGRNEAVDPILSGFFRGKVYREFEDLGVHEGYRKYKVTQDGDSKEDIIISIDESSGMIVKQDFYEGTGEQARIAYSYEVRDLKLSVDDDVLGLPADYTLVGYVEFQRARQIRSTHM